MLRASLTWRQAMLLRAYAKYMRQGNSPFAIDSIEGALADNVDLARMLVTFFETRFDPDLDEESRDRTQEKLEGKIKAALDDVVSLDHDRILRSYLTHIRATLRTNYFQYAGEERPKNYLSLKMEPSAIPDLPEPRPKFEIFVYSPRVEGVHLRFGAVARGGLRWSDRRDDFRTEILGLVKAQMVKNTVIVPVGAKGGFYAKQLPDPSDRDAWLAEGVECYKTFIRGLLDVTDNLKAGENVPPERVVRRDGNDSYLVVAADKGTATFSDIANGVSKDYGFWLGDAFASGGSVGYDHKAMGITARGAWVSVRRHFRELGIDCQTEDITVTGVGDMSGDVFGNGMLCSEHIRLIAAFDHRDIFIDPDPDAATSYAERKRLFEMPRSSWQDYDKSLISEGGGVFPRSAKSIPINHHIRSALGILRNVDAMTPAELMKAILLAPADLLWNGGIGTYVKATTETNADAGDKANDAIRVNGTELRVRVVGEGGNLGCTQRGRIEFANNGGRINTDFIDNSAGVDTSDREVNLKILLDRVVLDGDLTEKQRNKLLASMTDEVAELVLRDNYEQNLALANAARNAPSLLHVHEQWMQQLESEDRLDRDLEALPTKAEVKRRLEQGGALTQPELSVLMAYTKIVLAEELLASDLPEDPYCVLDLVSYFPEAVREGFGSQIEQHPLRREIIVTQVVNDLVNGAGMTYWPRLTGETGASAAELTRANFVAREIFGSLPLREELATYDNKIDAAVQTRMRVDMRTLVERASRWLITNRRPPARQPGHGRLLRDAGAGDDARTARAARRPRAVGLQRPPLGARRSTTCRRSSPHGWRRTTSPMPCSTSSRSPSGTTCRRSTSPGCTSRSGTASASLSSSSGSSTCRGPTSGRRWRGRPCATTCTRCTRSSPPRCWQPRPPTRRPPSGTIPRSCGTRRCAGSPSGSPRQVTSPAEPSRPSARSAPTRTPISPGSLSRSGWCAGCWPDLRLADDPVHSAPVGAASRWCTVTSLPK